MMISILLLVSRDFLLDKLFERLNELELPEQEVSIILLVDGDLNIFLKARNKMPSLKFAQKLCVRTEARSKRPSSSQHYRRRRIAELHNEAKQYIQGADLLFLLEDDGILPKDALIRLLKVYNTNDNVGFVSGLELGRWITPYIGGWLVDDPSDPQELQSIDIEQEVQEVHAAGLYCMLVAREVYEQHEFKPDPNYGPDLVFGFALAAKGYKNYMLTSLVVDHHTSNKVINLKTTQPKKTHMVKKRGRWVFVHRVAK